MSKECRVIFFHNHETLLRLQGLVDFGTIFHARGECLNINHGRDVRKLFPLPDGSLLYLKRFYTSRPSYSLKLAMREHERISRFIEYGFPGPECVAMGWSDQSRSGAFLLFKASPGVVPLDSFLRSTSPRCKKELIVNLAGVMGRMHAMGVLMPDLMSRHVMVLPEGSFYFIDLAHLAFRRNAAHPMVKDLARLSATLESAAASRSERIRFLRAYMHERGIDTRSRRPIRSLLWKIDVEERKARLHRRFPETIELQAVLSGQSRLYINTRFSAEMDALDLHEAKDFLSPGTGAQLLRDIGSRKNYKIDSGRANFYLKVHREGRPARGDSPGRREWNHHLRLIRMGLGCPVPAAWGEGPGFSFFMSLACPGQTGEQVAMEWDTLTAGRRKTLLKNMAVLVARLHASAFFHRDLYLCHVIVREERLHLIDLQRLEDGPLFHRHRQVKDLAALLFSSMHTPVRRTDRLRFLRVYLGGGRLTGKGKILAWAVERKARKISKRESKRRNEKVKP
ncbi:MAG: lipopolysaccharide kinase InaA family protein [Planctomycetota bacterium]